MENYSMSVPMSASIDVVQALKRFIYLHRYSIHLPSHIPKMHLLGVIPEKFVRPHHYREASNDKMPVETDPAELLDMAVMGRDILFRANTVFPFNLFPDTVTIDREKVTFANRLFFRVAKINSTPIQDIQSIEADVGPFFGTVKMTSKYFITNPREVTFLWRHDAIKIQHLIQGYVIAHERGVDCSKLDKEHLKILLEDLGKGDT